jgi:hypothetical protein
MPRNSSGTYSLPAGNPVVSGTLIETNWANPTMSDLGAALTDSLDRFGRGGMLAQLKLADGTLAAPAFAFNSEASTGLYRPAAATLNIGVLGSLVASFTNTAISFAKATTVNAALTVTGLLTASGGITIAGVLAWAGGTAALPGLAVAGDLDTGFYSVTANTIGASTSGVSRWLTTDEGLGLNTTVAALSSVGPQFRVQGRDVTHAGWASVVESTGAAWLGMYSGITVADNPAIVFNNTGALRFGTSTAQAVISFAELMRLTATGLGVGGTAAAKLNVIGGTTIATLTDWNTKANSQFNLANVNVRFGIGYTAADIVELQGYDSSNGARSISMQRLGGFVGIGGITPAYLLDILSPISGAKLFRFAANGATTLFGFSDSGGSGITNTDPQTGGALVYLSGQTVQLYTAGLERLRVDAAGRVGIGRTPTSNLLELAGTVGIVVASAAIDIGYSGSMTGVLAFALGFNNTAGTNAFGAPAGTVYFGAQAAAMVFTTSSAERVRIDAGGNVGIGATSVTAALEVARAATAEMVLRGNGGAYAAGLSLSQSSTAANVFNRANTDLQFGTNSLVRVVVTADGRLYGTALHNNAGAVTGTVNQYIASGTAASTFNNIANISVLTGNGGFRWIRVGNIVTVSGSITVTPTAAAANTQWTVTLPIASAVGGIAGALQGTIVGRDGGTNTITSGRITQDPVNPVALFIMTPPSNVAYICSFNFQYEVL